jgi:tRNA-dihydrouridine synthase A
MMGREAYQNPSILTQVDRELFDPSAAVVDGVKAIELLYSYIEQELSRGAHLGHITRHILGLFQGIPGARQWRRHLSENAHKPGADISVVEQALAMVTRPQTNSL